MVSRFFLLSVVLVLAGCGGDSFSKVPLKGQVTVDGVAVETGTISFAPLEANLGPDVPLEIVAGKYDGKVPKGKVRVFLQATRETGKMIEVFGKQTPEIVSVIPAKYSAGIELDTSTLTADHDFVLISSADAR